jgi:hypothetical protein
LTTSHPWRPLHPSLFSLPCVRVEETKLTPNPAAIYVLPHSSPQHPIVVTRILFPLLPVLAAVVHLSPFPNAIPLLSLIRTHIYNHP